MLNKGLRIILTRRVRLNLFLVLYNLFVLTICFLYPAKKYYGLVGASFLYFTLVLTYLEPIGPYKRDFGAPK